MHVSLIWQMHSNKRRGAFKKECFKEGLWEQLRPQNELKTFLLFVKGSSELETIESKIQWMIKKLKTLEETLPSKHDYFKIVKLGHSTSFPVLYYDGANYAPQRFHMTFLILNSAIWNLWDPLFSVGLVLSTSSEFSTVTEISTIEMSERKTWVPKPFLRYSVLDSGFFCAWLLARAERRIRICLQPFSVGNAWKMIRIL